MFPLRDNIPSLKPPVVTRALIAVNAAVFFYQLGLGPELEAFLFEYGASPVKLRLWGEYPGLTFNNTVMPFLYAQFLHGGWFHLISNMWYLWIFGDNVEDRLGRGAYLIFYLGCGAAAMAAQCLFVPDAVAPAVGASGAIAGVLGAYMMLFPRAKVLTLVPIFFFIELIELPALILLGLWFLIQVVSGLSAGEAAGVAWWAHIGGFAAGAGLANFLNTRLPPYRNAGIGRSGASGEY